MNSAALAVPAAALLASALVPATPVRAVAQSLRGSKHSIERMYRRARAEKLHFYETAKGVRNAVKRGTLVRLKPDRNFAIHAVGYPFVRPPTRTFVERLGAQYRDACGEQLVVTSAVRPATRQPANSTAHSVHPTGMAVDLRKPMSRDCLHWLRTTLLDLENAGLLEVTEEHAPPHFHVAVFPREYKQYVVVRQREERRAAVAQAGEPANGGN